MHNFSKYDIIYEDSNVADKLSELEQRTGRYIVFNSIPKLRLNALDVTIKRGDTFTLEGTESKRGYWAYYVNDPSSSDDVKR